MTRRAELDTDPGAPWTSSAYQAFAELYDAHGAIARELELAADALAHLLDVGATPPEQANLLTEVRRRVERAYAISAAERERWAR